MGDIGETFEPVDFNAKMAAREKYWDELTDSEKIERMRKEVRNLQSQNRRALNLIDKLTKHTHSENGDILTKVDFYDSIDGYNEIGRLRDLDKTYF